LGWIFAHFTVDLLQRIPEGKLPAQSLEGALRSVLEGAQGHAASLGYLPLGATPKIGQLYQVLLF
jgi:hypothetical protein